jgi:hypothetical protein
MLDISQWRSVLDLYQPKVLQPWNATALGHLISHGLRFAADTRRPLRNENISFLIDGERHSQNDLYILIAVSKQRFFFLDLVYSEMTDYLAITAHLSSIMLEVA